MRWKARWAGEAFGMDEQRGGLLHGGGGDCADG